MQTYLESKIDACGRVFGVVVSDDPRQPFTAGRLNPSETEVQEAGSLRCERRGDAIEYAAELALAWLRK